MISRVTASRCMAMTSSGLSSTIGLEAMARMDVKRKRSTPTDPETLSARVPGLIAQARELIEIEEALRTIPVQLAALPLPVSVVREAA